MTSSVVGPAQYNMYINQWGLELVTFEAARELSMQ